MASMLDDMQQHGAGEGGVYYCVDCRGVTSEGGVKRMVRVRNFQMTFDRQNVKSHQMIRHIHREVVIAVVDLRSFLYCLLHNGIATTS